MACLVCLALWTLLSGLDDLFITAVWGFTATKAFLWPADADLETAPERHIAVFVPLWREHGVIRQMLDHNLAAIQYRHFDVFVGVYPNDLPTWEAVAEAARRHNRIHVAVAPHDGPTSKGDCLNSIRAEMAAYESRSGIRFDIIVIHDAEDLIHPDSLRLINWYTRDYQMVQVPVLALPTGAGEFTHGLYCDEFAEFQSKDIPVRQRLGGFLPSNGVGTGFDRSALDLLAEQRNGRMFDPGCLTEDYEIGYRLHRMGCRQIFLPVRLRAGEPVATREYFPRRFRGAVRQRSRWVTGIALQGWQNHGWGCGRQTYWFWRDRKGLIGNLLSPLVSVSFLSGMVYARLREALPAWLFPLYAANAVITLAQMIFRMTATRRVYGWRLAGCVPFRMIWGNLVNCIATGSALSQFTLAIARREALSWRKTEHLYPARRRPRLGELLVRMRILPMSELEAALRSKPPSVRLGQHLMRLEKISEEHLHLALSRQQSGD